MPPTLEQELHLLKIHCYQVPAIPRHRAWYLRAHMHAHSLSRLSGTGMGTARHGTAREWHGTAPQGLHAQHHSHGSQNWQAEHLPATDSFSMEGQGCDPFAAVKFAGSPLTCV